MRKATGRILNEDGSIKDHVIFHPVEYQFMEDSLDGNCWVQKKRHWGWQGLYKIDRINLLRLPIVFDSIVECIPETDNNEISYFDFLKDYYISCKAIR